jgi:hypothetical protein
MNILLTHLKSRILSAPPFLALSAPASIEKIAGTTRRMDGANHGAVGAAIRAGKTKALLSGGRGGFPVLA